MSNGGPNEIGTRSRTGVPPGRLEKVWLGLCERDMLLRIALAFVAAVCVCIIIQAWDPPLHWRKGMVPTHFVTARLDFKEEKPEETAQKRLMAREETKAVFVQDVKPLEQLRASLRNTIAELTKTDKRTEKTDSIWKEFQPPQESGKPPAAPGRRRCIPGVPQGAGGQGEPQSLGPRCRRGLCSL